MTPATLRVCLDFTVNHSECFYHFSRSSQSQSHFIVSVDNAGVPQTPLNFPKVIYSFVSWVL